MCALYDFFAKLDAGWVNIATVLGALIGIGLSGFAIWFSKKLSDEGTVISEAIRKNTDATQKHTEAIINHTKILRLDSLRNLYELSRGQDTHTYWHFRWRFETYDCLSVHVWRRVGENQDSLGHCKILIQGFSNAADHIGFERRESEFYIVKIQSILADEGKQFPFAEDELAACFNKNGQLTISKGIDPWTLEPQFSATIGSLGYSQFGHGERAAVTARTFPRIKDS